MYYEPGNHCGVERKGPLCLIPASGPEHCNVDSVPSLIIKESETHIVMLKTSLLCCTCLLWRFGPDSKTSFLSFATNLKLQWLTLRRRGTMIPHAQERTRSAIKFYISDVFPLYETKLLGEKLEAMIGQFEQGNVFVFFSFFLQTLTGLF